MTSFWGSPLDRPGRRQTAAMPDFRIRLNDVDAAGVVFAARVCAIAHECYEDDLATAGFGLDRVLADGRYLLPLTRIEADFRKPLRHGDSITADYAVEVAVDRYVVRIRLRLPGGILAAEVAQHHRCVSASRTSLDLPTSLREALSRLPAGPSAAP
jgi:acyl-CoA thioesterase FadM